MRAGRGATGARRRRTPTRRRLPRRLADRGVARRSRARPGGRRRARRRTVDGAVQLEQGDATTRRRRGRRPRSSVMASGNLGLISFPREPGRVTLERLSERYPRPARRAARPPRDRVRARALRAARRGRARRARARTTSTTGAVEGEDPLAPFGPNAADHVARTDGFPHCPDLVVNSTYWADLDEVAAFEELVGSHGGMGGTQSHPFVLHPRELALPDERARRRRGRAPRVPRAGSCSSATPSTRRSSVPGHDPLARRRLRDLERDLRHAARAHAGARQARGGARAARAPAPARRAAADRARLGDAAAAGARRLGRVRRRARPAHARGGRRAQRRPRARGSR